MKTTKDLNFKEHAIGCFRARENFNNGYGVSVVFGEYFNGFEVAVLHDDKVTDEIYDGLLQSDVDQLMVEVQTYMYDLVDEDMPF